MNQKRNCDESRTYGSFLKRQCDAQLGSKFENSKFNLSGNTESNELYLAGTHRPVRHSQCAKFRKIEDGL